MNGDRSPRFGAVLCWALISTLSACSGSSGPLGVSDAFGANTTTDPNGTNGIGGTGTSNGTNGTSGASASNPGTPGANVAVNGPGFPGGGEFGADKPITVDLSPSTCATGRTDSHLGTVVSIDFATCYFPTAGSTTPAAIVERVIEVAQNQQLVHVRLTLNPDFVDNTYGATAVGWGGSGSPDAGLTSPALGAGAAPKPAPGTTDPKAAKPDPGAAQPAPAPKPKKGGHTFNDLVGSDKAEFVMTDGQGRTVLDFYLDYISVDTSRPSGYGSLGIASGEGKMVVGDASAIVAASSSLDRNLNACGYGSYAVDSPATDDRYTPNPATPGWDYRVVYDVWVRAAAFGASGFGDAAISYVHASPSKEASNTVNVTPGPCPPETGGGGAGAGEGGTGGSGQTGEQGGFGGEPPPPACLDDQEGCATPDQCCSGVCCQGICGMSQCIR